MSALSLAASLDLALRDAALRMADEHVRILRAAKVEAHNAAIDKASEIIADWIANGRDETGLFDQLQDAKIWLR